MPFDIAKSRMQAQVPDSAGKVEYTSVMQAMTKIVRTEGVSALFKGIGVTALRISLGMPVSLVAFEACRTAMRSSELEGAMSAQTPAAEVR